MKTSTILRIGLLCSVLILGKTLSTSAQPLVGTSWRASSAFTSSWASALAVSLDSIVMKFGTGHLWQFVYYPTATMPADSGTWSQVDMSDFSFSDTSSHSPFITHSVCPATQIDTDQYVIIGDTLRITTAHGGCTLREATMDGDWIGHNPTLQTKSVIPAGTLTVYPNPVDDVLHFSIGSITGDNRVQVFIMDVAGRAVFDEVFAARGGDAAIGGMDKVLQPGVYVLMAACNGSVYRGIVVKR